MHKEIKILPGVEDFLNMLPSILVAEGYKSNIENAINYVDEILSFIKALPFSQHYNVPENSTYYRKYGKNLKYSFFRRKSSRKTTWYIFFELHNNQILVKHISNNWTEGQFIR